MSPIEHAPTETNGSIGVRTRTAACRLHLDQALFFSLDTSAKINRCNRTSCISSAAPVGGGFGGKVDTLTEPLAILAARLTGAPVRYRLAGDEEMRFGSPRGAERIYIKDGVMRDGRIVARQVRAYAESGAYTRPSSYAVVECAAHLPGPTPSPMCMPMSSASSPIGCRRPRCAVSASPRSTSPWNVRWTRTPSRSAWTARVPPVQRLPRRDMKAHRREAKNCALIECAQVAAEKANGRCVRNSAGCPRDKAKAPSAAAARPIAPARRRPSRPREPDRVARSASPTSARRRRDPSPSTPSPGSSQPSPVPGRIDAWRARAFLPFSAPGGADHDEASRTRRRDHQLSDRHEFGGDPSQALVHSNPTGKFTVALSSIDLGQGMKSVTRQICAETLGVPVEDVYVDTADFDTGPHCMGSFASRGTHRVGNAVMAAAREARAVMMEAAAEELEVDPADLETDGQRLDHRQGRAASRDFGPRCRDRGASSDRARRFPARGIFLVPLSEVDPETGEMSPATCYAHAARSSKSRSTTRPATSPFSR